MRDHLVAVDIGSASARAGIFDRSGALIAREARPILLNRPDGLRAEHASEDLWKAVTESVRAALHAARISRERIAAIGFDATCSLVIEGPLDTPLSEDAGDGTRFDTISWMDHRALAETATLSSLGGPAIERAGGRISPEMALPKLLWLKRNRPDLWKSTSGIYDLADAMTFRATGKTGRSISTLASKWGYGTGEGTGWPGAFLRAAGLEDMVERLGLPERPMPLGTALGPLTAEAAAALDLDTGCMVAPGMIDAYAGALGLLGGLAEEEIARRAALVAGTSTCLIFLQKEGLSAEESLWGPFPDVALPGHALIEGGQSAAGSLLDHVVRMHAAGGSPEPTLLRRIAEHVNTRLAEVGPDYGLPIQVLPDFHGNRSPAADPLATGVISGLSLDTSFDSLCRLYWRTAVGLACGLRQILERFGEAGLEPDCLHLAGGHAQNPLLVQLYADMTGKKMIVPKMREAILLGSAINAATAAGLYPTLGDAARAMGGEALALLPDAARKARLDRDYERHLMMIRHRRELSASL